MSYEFQVLSSLFSRTSTYKPGGFEGLYNR